ncbi:MAG TPA: type II secretion system protein [Thermoanaerobaculia bacterium]|nr:type II secretion system protein [Thermoanaerobaculia bacterium]
MRPVLNGRGEAGYNLVILMVLVTVMNIAVAVALPSWSKFAQREKEEELIFRGLQYAEAIRVFQTRHGRPPNTLEELIEVEPRSIRQLYPNPMTENGKWGLLVQAPPGAGGRGRQPAGASGQGARSGDRRDTPQPQQPGDDGTGGAGVIGQPGTRGGPTAVVPIPPTDEEEGFGRPTQRTTGPILGVYAGVEGEGIKSFFGQSSYATWHFTADLLPMPVMLGGDAPAPRVTAAWVGRPFREDLQPHGGNVPGRPGAPGRDLTAPDDRSRSDGADRRLGGSDRSRRRERP